MTQYRRLFLALACFALAIPLVGRADPYVAGGTVVFKQAGQQPDVDSGAVVCDTSTGIGVGGGCLPFPNNANHDSFVAVSDVLANFNVAFQVCIDTNGDSKCVSGPDQQTNPCADKVWFSHNDAGMFFNPLGPLPTTRGIPGQDQCNPRKSGWDGYVVFLCEGAHVVDGAPHQHLTTTGVIGGSPTGPFPGQYGDFCGGIRGDVIKDYVVV